MSYTQLWTRHEKIVSDRVWKIARERGRNAADLFSQAHMAFMNAAKTWDRTRPFGTWLFRCVTNSLLDYLRKYDQPPRDHMSTIQKIMEITDQKVNHPSVRLIFLEELESLSLEALFVIGVALSGDLSMLSRSSEGNFTPKRVRGLIRTFLVCDVGWSPTKTSCVFREIRFFLKKLENEKKMQTFCKCY